jgi:hypothetical protein
MTTLKERFEEQFVKDAVRLRIVGQQTGFVFPDEVTGSILAFFRQELLSLADQVERGKDSHTGIYRMGIEDAAERIRSKADELV